MTIRQRTNSGILLSLSLIFLLSLAGPVYAADPIWILNFSHENTTQGFDGMVRISPDNKVILASNPEGSELFVVSQNGTLLWAYTPDTTLTNWTKPRISGIAISSENEVIGISVMYPGCYRGIITKTPSNRIMLFDTKGHFLWNYSTSDAPQSIAISKNGQDIFVGYETRSLSCLNRDGTVRWNYQTDSPISRIEVSPEGNFLLASGENIGGQYTNDVFFFTRDGALLWKKQLRGENSLAISSDLQNLMISGYPTGNTYSVYPDGKIRWEDSFANIGTVLTVAANGRFVLAGTEERIHMLDNQGIEIWDYKTSEPVYSISVSEDGDIIGAGAGKDLVLMNRTGTVLWQYTTNDTVIPVVVSEDGAYIAAISDRLYFFNSLGDRSIITSSEERAGSDSPGKSTASSPTAKPATMTWTIAIFASALSAAGILWFVRRAERNK